MIDNINVIQKRFQIHLQVVPFDALAQPVTIEEDDPYVLKNIHLVDENGGKIATVSIYETVGKTLEKLSDDEREDAKFVLMPETRQIALIPQHKAE